MEEFRIESDDMILKELLRQSLLFCSVCDTREGRARRALSKKTLGEFNTHGDGSCFVEEAGRAVQNAVMAH